MQNEKKEKHPR